MTNKNGYPPPSIVVVLNDIRSVYNVGSIFRTADAAGVAKIYLCGITPAPVDRFGKIRPQFQKVSLGAEKSMRWERARSAEAILARLKKDGYKVFAVEQSRKAVPYQKVKVQGKKLKPVLVFGNEVRGLPGRILDHADQILEIPMRGAMIGEADHPRRSGRGKESLNVAVAFGIVVFAVVTAFAAEKPANSAVV